MSAPESPRFETRAAARREVVQPLEENRAIFELYGPRDEEYDADRAHRWRKHVVEHLIPNNRRLRTIVQANYHLLTDAERATVARFELHARELEERHLKDDWAPGSTRFPIDFIKVFRDDI